MDNMLYIIAGLALILLVAALFLRKNKAQKSSSPSPINARKDTPTPSPKVDYDTPTHTNVSNSHKFDHITIAQRFMDQQRYDKAIETIKRGLSEKPHNSALSLKLLSIYATINQPEDFNNIYESIRNHNDSQTIAQADEIRNLSFDELEPAAAQTLATDNAKDDFDAIDFDLPISQNDSTNTVDHQSIEESNNDTAINEPIDSLELSDKVDNVSSITENPNDSFDLTLSDLENDFAAPNMTSETPVIPLDNVDNDVLESSANDNVSNNEDNDLSDFEFDFDSFDDTSNESSIDTNLSHNDNEKAALEEDFILDFDDLAANADKDNVVTNDVSTNSEQHSVDALQNGEDDFALSLGNLDTLDDIDTVSNDDLSTTENDSGFDNFILENTDCGNNTSESITLEEDNFANINLEEPLFNDNIEVNDVSDVEESNVVPDEPLVFDDSKLIDDNFDIDDTNSLFDFPSDTDPVSTAAPVEAESPVPTQDTESAEEFSSRFAADFDFVKSLDSNQVTLDLAGQYLQLGEYDSAKRLLNEVIAQGNSEQKQQAQLLLERTA
ncbi:MULTISPECIES: FimV/HubP family polar landmark protein [Psychrobacter]|uniref:FimV/HubP family polar landmark protein n=1 Tax=Psychrobacter TaxID=497 RepID=UPI000C32A6C1|nr:MULTISPECIES: FimV/HubP family polar landmark protein [Psychrobacter]MBA6245397.1 pilus assembly protein FimV [Psychrobacter sp. Urea-trap-18]MBA6286861.1 pilus assembly protein FimV [Psychrobacter sp. Urea-trap-16]MBA6317957.1 pilus assembly protein FimV [Psychrobacter sp. Urea-trap-20]MBA6335202.1 pilus assembly protein FimV [Psychrobacter sp. Urea-trap-19]PKG60514.1 pilus assembly protein FimV [Psychrobacter sp. Choline-3u-12]